MMKYFFFLFFLSLYINVSAQYNNKNYIIDNSKLKLNNINFNYNVKSFNIKLKSTKNKDPKIDFIYYKKILGKEFSINTYYNSRHLLSSRNMGFIAKLKLSKHFKISLLSETDQMNDNVYYISGKLYYIF